ncbi:LysR family transcriptional regulator [Geodermatophilus chilensis]|jgi:DNA-binding transcriptional LysR family regulator|uniref:LysR family transcriptional regulator n=1 Tax=Geodermatophilus chilensis TaxID=2035835 RepID=UPI000C265356|nr:LysR family transcriptional regulator [Geodermatophilus chilensis]
MTADLRHLRAFLHVVDAGTITAAAAKMHMSQPAVSRLLAQLEAHLNTCLVDRSTHHLALTRAGAAYRERVVAAVAAVDAVLDPAALSPRPLRLGHAWSALGAHTPRLLRRWGELHPDVELQLVQIEDRSAGLWDGRVDIAVIRGPVSRSGFRSSHLHDEARLAAISVEHPLAHQPQLSLIDLADNPVLVNSVTGTTGAGLWPSDHRPARTIEVGSTEDWLAAVAAGRGVGITPSSTTELYRYPGVEFVPLTDAPPVPVFLVWSDPPTHPAVDRLVRLANEVIREAPTDFPGRRVRGARR